MFSSKNYTILLVWTAAVTVLYGVDRVACQASQVKLPQGLVQGKVLRSRSGKEFYGFMGIPYVQQPERFQPARRPPPSWEGIYDATSYRSKCVQFNLTSQLTEGSEDCLYINVFTPKPTANLSVLAFIHGGGFQFGLAYENGPEFIMDHDVVFVTFSYRLAALGFLSMLDSEVLSDNLGLKDQNAALQWIQENVRYFGGDKYRVTLFGESAGSASVSGHILSPMSSGLFKQAICQSGTALDRWSIVEKPKESAIKLASALNCPTASSREIVECLKTKSAKEIVEVQLQATPIDSLIAYGPVIEPEGSVDKPAFLTESPRALYEQGKFAKVPLMMTVNNLEGLLLNTLGVLASPELIEAFNKNWTSAAVKAFMLDKEFSPSEVAQTWAAQKLRDFYFETRSVGKETLMNLTNIYSDSGFIHRTRRTALMHAKHAPVYLAVLAFKGIWSQANFFGFEEILGMTHADDLSYLFTDFKYPPFPQDSESEVFSKLLVKLWVNFANTGNPGFELNGQRWQPLRTKEIRSEVINWLYLKNEHEFLAEPLQERMALWDQIDEVLKTGVIPGKDEL